MKVIAWLLIHMHYYGKYLCENLINCWLIVILTLCTYTGQMLYVYIAISTVCAKVISSMTYYVLYICADSIVILFHSWSLQNRENGDSDTIILKRLNVQAALNCLKQHKVKLDGITGDSIASGTKNQILGLVWTLFLHFELGGRDNGNDHENSTAPDLLSWVQAAVEPWVHAW